MKIAVVVLHYRNLEDTLECLDSLQKQDYLHYEIILVDNASGDPLKEIVKDRAKLHLISNPKNLGFAEGSNGGIRCGMHRGADAVLLLNNDTVASPTLLSSFVEGAAAYPNAAIFGGKIFFYDEPTILWHAGGNVHPRSMRCYHDGCGSNDLEKQWDTIRSINYACGCALFVKKEAIEKVGLMAPEFFLLWEEIDWCWRIRKSGYDCLYLPQAKVWHKISRSFEGGNRGPLWQYYYFRNRLLFLRRNICFTKRMQFYFTVLIKEIVQIITLLLNPKTTKETAKLNASALKGIRDYFLRK